MSQLQNFLVLPFRTATRAPAAGLLCAALLLPVAGCNKPIDDATLNAAVHNALANDPSLTAQQSGLQTTTRNGVVTLSGNVTDSTASSVAAQDAARVAGVKEVVNSLQVAGIQATPTVTSPAAPTSPRVATNEERTAIAQRKPLPAPAVSAGLSTAAAPVPSRPAVSSAPPPPPAPTFRDVRVPVGTTLLVRLTEGLSSKTTQVGDTFNGTVARPVVADGVTVIPSGSAVSGRVVEAKDAGHFKGHSLLSIELTGVRRRGELVAVSTAPYVVEGKNRGTNSAVKIGGGAAVGAVLGGIFGGGKGAAIGGLAGGGAGTAAQGLTRGQEVTIPSETEVRFSLAHSITVRTSGETAQERDRTSLQTRP